MNPQEKSGAFYSPAARLKKLRAVTGLSWVKIAGKLAISEQMIYKVNAGDTGVSDKLLHRLEQAEKEAGIEPPVSMLENAAIRQGATETLDRVQLIEFKEAVRHELETIEGVMGRLRKMIQPTRYKIHVTKREPVKPSSSEPSAAADLARRAAGEGSDPSTK